MKASAHADSLYVSIFEAAAEAYLVVDDQQTIVSLNRTAKVLLGVADDDPSADDEPRHLCDLICVEDLGQPPAAEGKPQQRARNGAGLDLPRLHAPGRIQGEARLRSPAAAVRDVEYEITAALAPNRHLMVLRSVTTSEENPAAPDGASPSTRATPSPALVQQLKAQLDLQQSRLEGLLSSVPGVVWEAWGTPEGAAQRIDFVSDYVETMLGYTVEEWLATPNFWLSVVHPDDRERAAAVSRHSFETGVGHVDQFRWIAKDGRVLWVEAHAAVIHDDSGRAIGMRGVTIDITARQEAQIALAVSEERFRFLFEQAPMSMQLANREGRTIRVNRAFEKLWNLTLDQLKDYNFFNDQQLAEKGILPHLMKAFNGQPVMLPEAYYDPRPSVGTEAAHPRWTRPVAYPILSNGEVAEVVLVHEDITDWKRAEGNLRLLLQADAILASSLDYETTLKNLAHAVVPSFADYCVVHMFEGELIRQVALTHRDPTKTMLIAQLQQRFPIDPDAAAGPARVWRTGEPEMVESLTVNDFEKSAQSKEQLSLLRLLRLKSYICVPLRAHGEIVGAITWVRDQNSPSYDAHDLELAQDLGRRAAMSIDNARLYRECNEALTAAEAANRAKDEFLAVVSHELRTPLNAISGWASLLRTHQLDEPTENQAIEIIERNCHVQTKLIEDILEVSRIVSGTIRLEKSSVELTSIVQSAVSSVQAMADRKSIGLTYAAPAMPLLVHGDEIRLQQIISNLLSNAIKFTPENGRVEIGLRKVGQHATVRVVDNGKGIDADFLPHVFDRFSQADGSSTRPFGGLGLGLAIVRHLVTLHDGAVFVQSAGEGQGATFTIELPLLPQAPLSEEAPLEYSQAQQQSAENERQHGLALQRDATLLSGRHILVVDDEPDACTLLRLILESHGATVTTATRAAEALQVLEKQTPSLLISDIAMPGQDGYELIAAIRTLPDEKKQSIPAIALTAFAGPEAREKALEAGFQVHLSKPVVAGVLVREIQGLLN